MTTEAIVAVALLVPFTIWFVWRARAARRHRAIDMATLGEACGITVIRAREEGGALLVGLAAAGYRGVPLRAMLTEAQARQLAQWLRSPAAKR